MAAGNGTDLRAHPTRCETALSHHEPIAVVGIGCRFPGRANDPETFWRLLEDGVDAVTEIPRDRWNLRRFSRSRSLAAGQDIQPLGRLRRG